MCHWVWKNFGCTPFTSLMIRKIVMQRATTFTWGLYSASFFHLLVIHSKCKSTGPLKRWETWMGKKGTNRLNKLLLWRSRQPWDDDALCALGYCRTIHREKNFLSTLGHHSGLYLHCEVEWHTWTWKLNGSKFYILFTSLKEKTCRNRVLWWCSDKDNQPTIKLSWRV